MANIKSALKRIKIAERRTLINKGKKSELKTLTKKFDGLVASKNFDEASEVLKVIDRKLKRASISNLIHKNAANRRLSRLSKMLNIKNA